MASHSVSAVVGYASSVRALSAAPDCGSSDCTSDAPPHGTHEYVCEPHEAVGMVGTVVVEPAPVDVGPIEPDPTLPVEPPSESSGESWIPFFGLEIVFLSLLVILIYQYGRKSGMAETSFLTPDDSGSDEE